MKLNKTTLAQRQTALRAIEQTEKKIGQPLFGWAVRKYLAIQAARRKAAKIQHESQEKITRLERLVAVR